MDAYTMQGIIVYSSIYHQVQVENMVCSFVDTGTQWHQRLLHWSYSVNKSSIVNISHKDNFQAEGLVSKQYTCYVVLWMLFQPFGVDTVGPHLPLI